MSLTVIEQFVRGKKDVPALCEDVIFVSADFCAVIDGATAKVPLDWRGQSSGRFAAATLAEGLNSAPPQGSAAEVIDYLSRYLNTAISALGHEQAMAEKPAARPVASLILLSVARRELWRVGDCLAMVNQTPVWDGEKAHNKVSSAARAVFLQALLLDGASVEELRAKDPSRDFIRPLLEGEAHFLNRPEAGEFWFAAMNGLPVPREGIDVYPLPDGPCEVVLTSDGLPTLKPTLAEALFTLEANLKADPLCIHELRGSKAHASDQWSFDDVSYLRVSL